MFNLTTKSTPKFSILVTSFVLLAACSAKQIKNESDAFQPTPEPIVDSTYQASSDAVSNDTTYNETEYSAPKAASTKKSSAFKKSKKKTKYVKSGKKAKGKKVAKHSKRKPIQAAVTAQIDNNSTPTGGSSEALQQPILIAEPVAPPPPPFIEPVQNESATVAQLATSWGFWLVTFSALGLLGLAYKVRRSKGPGRRLVYNS